MTVKAQIIGADKVKRRLKHIPSATEAHLREVIFKAAQEVQAASIEEIQKPKGGRIYRKRVRSGNLLQWRASAPGEAPARKTGERMAKIKAKKSNRKLKPQSRVVAPGIYRLLARGLANIAPRPLFGPLFQRFAPKIRDRMKAETLRKVRETAKK